VPSARQRARLLQGDLPPLSSGHSEERCSNDTAKPFFIRLDAVSDAIASAALRSCSPMLFTRSIRYHFVE
jgi:hypothetical protein